jgi:hypothetical protein
MKPQGLKNVYSLAKRKCKAGLLGSLCKVLTANGHVAKAKVVIGDETLHGPSAILDGESGAIGRVGR